MFQADAGLLTNHFYGLIECMMGRPFFKHDLQQPDMRLQFAFRFTVIVLQQPLQAAPRCIFLHSG